MQDIARVTVGRGGARRRSAEESKCGSATHPRQSSEGSRLTGGGEHGPLNYQQRQARRRRLRAAPRRAPTPRPPCRSSGADAHVAPTLAPPAVDSRCPSKPRVDSATGGLRQLITGIVKKRCMKDRDLFLSFRISTLTRPQLPHSRTYSMAEDMCKVIGYDSFSELPGIHLGTCWTVRSAMLMYKEEKKKKNTRESLRKKNNILKKSMISTVECARLESTVCTMPPSTCPCRASHRRLPPYQMGLPRSAARRSRRKARALVYSVALTFTNVPFKYDIEAGKFSTSKLSFKTK
jgi:hypothetical protein